MRKINTMRFGEIEISEDKIVHFSRGIPAFEDEHEFVIIPYDEESPYYFMQSLKSPELAFLITTPFVFFPDYSIEVDDETMNELNIQNSEDVLLYSIITIPNGSIRYMTANLLAPLIVNTENMQAKQLVMEKTRYNTKHRLFPDRGVE
ncbi:MAG: flagellar assembly protein FliW [Selenomonadaceae bacterium]|nr:flagellar assembly protein FliW [Selenomonadaceae bacterium]